MRPAPQPKFDLGKLCLPPSHTTLCGSFFLSLFWALAYEVRTVWEEKPHATKSNLLSHPVTARRHVGCVHQWERYKDTKHQPERYKDTKYC